MSSASASRPGLVLGAAPFARVEDNPNAKFRTPEVAEPIFQYLRDNGITHLDSARRYPPGSIGKAEEFLGEINASSWATIDTKISGFRPGTLTAANIAKDVSDSLAALKVDRVHTMYLHAPDRSVPLTETLRAVDKEYRAGRFEHFGLSNYPASEVAEILRITEEEGLVRPTVYQGQYNAIFRAGEKELFPLLRKNGIPFYAYSPTAAGIFSGKVTRESANVSGSRWDNNTHLGSVYRDHYFKDSVFEAASKVHKAAEQAGIDGHAAAMRWALYHSVLSKEHGDHVILGISSLEQLKSNLAAANAGPLPEDLAALISEVWPLVESENSKYHF